MAGATLPLPNDSFGKLEGILDFCAKTDPQAAPKYQERKRLIADSASEKEIAEARNAQDYKDGYQGISDVLVKVSNEKAVKACSAYLEDE
jgi:hypothetical protein